MTRALRVLSPGLLTTVQDLGRPGLAAWGVPRAGALDPEALRAANRLVGNDDGEAGLEIWFTGPRLVAEGDVTLAVLGGRFSRQPILELSDGDEVELKSLSGASRAVVAISGGVDVPTVLGSRSTCLTARFGGVFGRRLQKGDRLTLLPERGERGDLPLPADLFGSSDPEISLQVLPGPHEALFSRDAVETFYRAPYTILPESNRTGFRLGGPPLTRLSTEELPSEGTLVGSIQITHAGQPIVLLNEGPTTGGYPKIGTLPARAVCRLVRAKASQTLRFVRIGDAATSSSLFLSGQR